MRHAKWPMGTHEGIRDIWRILLSYREVPKLILIHRRSDGLNMLRKVCYRKQALVLAAVLAVSAAFSGCGKEAVQEEDKDLTIPVESAKPELGDLTLENSFIGTISPEDTVSVMPLAAGVVTETNFEVGDRVNAGDVLFKIDDSTAQLQLAAAKLGKANADIQAASALGPQQELSLLSQQAALDQLNNQIASAAQGMDQTRDSKQDQEDQKKDLEDQKSDLNHSINDSKDKIKNLETLAAQFQSNTHSQTAPDGALPNVGETFNMDVNGTTFTFVVTEKSQALSVTSPNIEDKSYYTYTYQPYKIADMTSEDVSGALTALQSAISTMESAKGNLDTALGSMDSAIKNIDNGLDSAQNTLDFLNKSKATTEKSNAIQNGELLENTKGSLAIASQSSQLNIETAELALSYYTVTAPISGVIEQKNVNVNEPAANGYAAYVISNKESMVATFNVSEDIMNTLRPGQKVSVERNGTYYEGVLTEINHSVDQRSGLFLVKASVMANGDKLSNGVSVKLSLDTYSAKQSMLIPYDAVYYDDGAAYVYIIRDGKAVKTPIETGIFDDTRIVVVSGLTLEDEVITTWSPQLADGMPVKTGGNMSGNPESAGTGSEAGKEVMSVPDLNTDTKGEGTE